MTPCSSCPKNIGEARGKPGGSQEGGRGKAWRARFACSSLHVTIRLTGKPTNYTRMGLYTHPNAFSRVMRAACAVASLFFMGPGGAALAAPSFEGYVGKFVVANPPEQAPDIPFSDADGVKHRLSDYRSKVVLLNFWATWCPACVMEMPALDRLQGELDGDGFVVLAVSQDATGAAVVSRFLQAHRLNHVRAFIDDQRRLGSAFDQDMLPTSILLDPEGREVGRLVGPADWHSPEAMALIHYFMRRSEDDTTRAPLQSPNPAVRSRRPQQVEATRVHDADPYRQESQ